MTNLEQLHKVHSELAANIVPARRTGRTLYACHELCGMLEVLENETIVVDLPFRDRVKHFRSMLKMIMLEHGLRLDGIRSTKDFWYFSCNTNRVYFTCYQDRRDVMDIPGVAADTFCVIDPEPASEFLNPTKP